MATTVATAAVDLLLDRKKFDRSVTGATQKLKTVEKAAKRINFKAANTTAQDLDSGLGRIQTTLAMISAATIGVGIARWLQSGSDSADAMNDRLETVKNSFAELGEQFANELVFGKDSYEWAEILARELGKIPLGALARLTEALVVISGFRIGSQAFAGITRLGDLGQTAGIKLAALRTGLMGATGVGVAAGSAIGTGVTGAGIGAARALKPRGGFRDEVEMFGVDEGTGKKIPIPLKRNVREVPLRRPSLGPFSEEAARSAKITKSIKGTTTAFGSFKAALIKAAAAIGTFLIAFQAGKWIGSRIPGLPASRNRKAEEAAEEAMRAANKRTRTQSVLTRGRIEESPLFGYLLKTTTARPGNIADRMRKAEQYGGTGLTQGELKSNIKLLDNELGLFNQVVENITAKIARSENRLDKLKLKEAGGLEAGEEEGFYQQRRTVQAMLDKDKKRLVELNAAISKSDTVRQSAANAMYSLWTDEKDRASRLKELGEERGKIGVDLEESLKSIDASTRDRLASMEEVYKARIASLQPRNIMSSTFSTGLSRMMQQALEMGTARESTEKQLKTNAFDDVATERGRREADVAKATKLSAEHLTDLKKLEEKILSGVTTANEKQAEFLSWLQRQVK